MTQKPQQPIVVHVPQGVSVDISVRSNGQAHPVVTEEQVITETIPAAEIPIEALEEALNHETPPDPQDLAREMYASDPTRDMIHFTPTRLIDGHPFLDLEHITPDANLDVIRDVVRSVAASRPDTPLRIIEIGPWVGASTIAIAQGIGTSGGFVFAVDSWNGTPGGYLSDVVEKEGGREAVFAKFRANLGTLYDTVVKPVEMIALRAIAELDVGLVDIVFYDGSYKPTEVVDNLRGWIPKLKEDGLLVGQACGPEAAPCLQAVESVLQQYGGQLQQYNGSSVWAIQKKDLIEQRGNPNAPANPFAAAGRVQADGS